MLKNGLFLFLLSILIYTSTIPKPVNAQTPPENLLKNTSFEDYVYDPTKPNRNPASWRTVEGTTNAGTGTVTDKERGLIKVLCKNFSSVKPLDGKCVVSIQTDLYKKAFIEQTYSPIVIDGTLIQDVNLYIPDNSANANGFFQHFELRQGPIPGAAGQTIQVHFKNSGTSICIPPSPVSTIKCDPLKCKNFPAFSKNTWQKLRITTTKKPNVNPEDIYTWDLKIENRTNGQVYFDSSRNPNDILYVKNIPRERIEPQIGTLFIGDECQTGPGAKSCDGIGQVYYDGLNAVNPGGTGRSDYITPGDANGDKKIDNLDFEILKTNYLNTINGNPPPEYTNAVGDFYADGKLDSKDFATWTNRSGQL